MRSPCCVTACVSDNGSHRRVSRAATLQAVYLVRLFLHITTTCNLSIIGLVHKKNSRNRSHMRKQWIPGHFSLLPCGLGLRLTHKLIAPNIAPCTLKIGDGMSSKMCYDVTQSLNLLNSSKETACCRVHPSRSFQTPKNKGSQNMKPLSTSDSPETILLTLESLRNFTLPVFKLRNTHRPFTEVLGFLCRSFSGSTRLRLLLVRFTDPSCMGGARKGTQCS